jgi:hypothetical protein
LANTNTAFDNTLAYKNFPNAGVNDKGIILADNTDGGKLTKLLREMRRYNPIPSMIGTAPRNIPLRAVIEDPVFRDSANSLFHQMVDVVAYFAKQHYQPNKYMRTKGGRHYYTRFLTNVVNRKVTLSKRSPNFIVEV